MGASFVDWRRVRLIVVPILVALLAMSAHAAKLNRYDLSREGFSIYVPAGTPEDKVRKVVEGLRARKMLRPDMVIENPDAVLDAFSAPEAGGIDDPAGDTPKPPDGAETTTAAVDEAMASTASAALLVGAGFLSFVTATAIGPYLLLKSASQWWRTVLALVVGIATGVAAAGLFFAALWSYLQPTNGVWPEGVDRNQTLFIGTVFWGTVLGIAFGFRRARASRETGEPFMKLGVDKMLLRLRPFIKRLLRPALIALGVVVLLDLVLLITDRRVLVWEHKVNPGDNFVVEEWGDLGTHKGSTLVCRYFTGRTLVTAVFDYSPNNFLGQDSCPFMLGR